MSRNMQFGKIDTLMGMSAGDVVNAQGMQAAGNAQMMAGIGDAAGGIATFAGQAAGWGGGLKSGIPDANGQFSDFASYNENMGGNMTQSDWVAEQQNYLNLQNAPKSIYG